MVAARRAPAPAVAPAARRTPGKGSGKTRKQYAEPPKPSRKQAGPPARSKTVRQDLSRAFNGFDGLHMPTDEHTAPYTTTNLTSVLEFGTSHDADKLLVVCARTSNRNIPSLTPTGTDVMTDFIAMLYDASETIDGTIPTIDALRSPVISRPARHATNLTHFSVRGRLHNLSARLQCLGTDNGVFPPGSVYMGKVPMIETGAQSTGGAESLTIKQAWADDSIAVGYIKPFTATELLKGHQINSTVSEQVSYRTWRDFVVPPESENLGAMHMLTSLEPIVIYIPRAGASGTTVNYRLTVGEQWCTRHPHDVMLRATQRQHVPTDRKSVV